MNWNFGGNSNLIRKKLAILIQNYRFYVGLRKNITYQNFPDFFFPYENREEIR